MAQSTGGRQRERRKERGDDDRDRAAFLETVKHNKKRSNKSNNRVEENKDRFTVNNSKKQKHLAFQHLAGV